MRRIAVLGPPGAERETVAELIAARVGVPLVTIRDVMQAAFRDGTPAAAEADRSMRSGDLVPDDLAVSMVLAHLRDGFVLDGFPRTLAQAELLTAGLAAHGTPLDRVIDLVVSDGEAARRLVGRRLCRGCGRAYHLESDPPAEPGRCDRCGGELIHREHDTPATVAVMLQRFRADVAPTLAYYRAQGLLVSVDASPAPEEVAVAAC